MPENAHTLSNAEKTANSVGQHHEVTITGVAHGGVFVGRIDGRVVFVPDTIPGETVQVRVTEDRGSFLRADLERVIEPSASRVPHIWPEAELGRAQRPGGADFGHIALARQRALKEQVIRDALTRIGKLSAPEVAVEPVGSGEVRERGTGWRTRVGLHVGEDGITGPMAARTRDVVEVSGLPLAHPDLVALGEHRRRHPGARRVDLIWSEDGALNLVDGQPDQVITRTAAGFRYRVQATGFWQVHRDAGDVLISAVQDALATLPWDPDAGVVDLYGGVGLFAVPLAAAGAAVTTVEADTQASDLAAQNIAPWGGEAVSASTLWFLRRAREQGRSLEQATVILDPPRAGAGREVVAELVRAHPAQVLYIACDPVSFARDAGELVRAGYAMTSLRGFDLYPNSHHVETLAVFVRS